jgi:predicted alpha/beta hydrolase
METLNHPDGTQLGATVTPGRRDEWVVIGGATAVPHRFYGPLSEWLSAEHGLNVLSFDYRGVGASKRAPLPGFEASYDDWASDLDVAIGWAADRGPAVVMGHSFGGHAFGMGEGHARALGLYTFATGAGWAGHMPCGEGLKVRALWNLIAPPLVAWKGYLPFSMVGMGEDLPRGIYADWKRWCAYPNYVFDDPERGEEMEARFARVEAPVVGVCSTDDAWAGEASARAFLSHYPDHDVRVVTPADVGVPSIGHMGYVRPKCEALWHPMVEWFEARFRARSVR